MPGASPPIENEPSGLIWFGAPNIIIIDSPRGIANTKPIIGRPCESTAVPEIRAVRVVISAMLTSLTIWPSPIVTRCASAMFEVPGK